MLVVGAAIVEQAVTTEVVHSGAVGYLVVAGFITMRALELNAQMLRKKIIVGWIAFDFVISVRLRNSVRFVSRRLRLRSHRS